MWKSSMVNRCALALLVCFGADNAAAQTCPAARWERVPPPTAGWSPKRLRDADAIAQQLDTHSYVVVQGGRIVWEFGSTSLPSNVHSVRKSIASVLFGIAHDRGSRRAHRPSRRPTAQPDTAICGGLA